VDDALKTFVRALKTAGTIERGFNKAWVLLGIAAAQAKAGLVDDALKTFARALKTTDYETSERYSIAALQAQAGPIAVRFILVDMVHGIYSTCFQAFSDVLDTRKDRRHATSE